jgi:hypothetical protein
MRRAAQVIIKSDMTTEDPLRFPSNAQSDPVEPTILRETTQPLWPNDTHAPSRSPREEALFLYQHPIVFPTQMHIASLDDYESAMHMVQCGILFNLALASHLLALGSTSDTAALVAPLELACELYHSALAGMDWDCSPSIMNMSMNNALWQCIILNNLAHLHHELCEPDDCTYCLDCAQELVVHGNCLDVFEHIHEDDAQEIKLKPLFFKPAAKA